MKKIVVGILAHVDSGKTTLCEAMMYTTGNLKKLGRVDHRDSFLDTFALERDRGITIFSKQAMLNLGDTQITLLDTPGHVDFSAETERTLQVLDYAILVISGTDGVQSHTATLWKLLAKYSVPCFLFVNKMDLPDTDRRLLTAQLRNKLSDGCVDFGCPDKDELTESLALCDEALLAEYDESGTIADDSISRAVRDRKIFPCLFGSALKLDGVEALTDCLRQRTIMPDYGEAFAAKVYKIAQDNQKNRLTFLKITGGSLRVREVLNAPQNTENEKVNQIRVYSGEKFTAVEEACAGTVCAVTGITFAKPGDGLGAEPNTGAPVLRPVLTYTLLLPDGTDTHTAIQKMRQLEAEDPMMNVSINERTGDIRLRLMGEIQTEVLQSVIRERFGMDVSFGQGSIIYKETIENTVEGVGHFEPLRHYAEVHLILKPLKRDSGLLFNTACREDLLDRNWQRLILTHLYEKTHIGVLTGSPITDMEITLAAGKAHPKHTEGGDFRQATYRAVRQGLRQARSILLEPVYEFTLEIPADNAGRAMADIGRMYGSFEPAQINGETAVLRGKCPVATMRDYAKEVVQYTRGTGRLSCTLSGYEPCHNADEVIAEIGYDPDADVDNPCDSVFCSHGAGHTVKWDEVKSRMHLSGVMDTRTAPTAPAAERLSRYRSSDDVFALDKELMSIFESTYGPIRKRSDNGNTSARRYDATTGKKQRDYRYAPKYDGPEYLLIDGYNVIYAWDKLRALAQANIDAARSALINILCNYQGYRKCELILVFDAYRVKGHDREVERVENISVVYTKEAETADTYIEKTSHQLAKNHRVRVVTSDVMEQLIIIGNGAVRVSSEDFYEEVRTAEEEIREIIESPPQHR